MPNILFFSRNRCTSVEQLDKTSVRSLCRLQDTLFEAQVEIEVKLPDLEITKVEGLVLRSEKHVPPEAADLLKNVLGVRIGPSMTKILRGLIVCSEDTEQFISMVEECCHGVILSFTKEVLQQCPSDKKGIIKFFADKVKENIRLYDRCAAFAPGSVIVEEIEFPVTKNGTKKGSRVQE